MKAIIPVKSSSIRVPNKNFKPFHDDDSLFDITVKKLLKILPPSDIYMSCESEELGERAKKYGINFILRDPVLADNDTKFYDVFNGICDQVPGDEDIAWCQVIDPMFNSYKECFELWNSGTLERSASHLFGRDRKTPIRTSHDSLVVVYPHKDYYLDENHSPLGFGFGPWHTKSQSLPCTYQLTFTLSILTRESIREVGYHVGQKPYWYHAYNPRVDIDTEQDFIIAKTIYSILHDDENVCINNSFINKPPCCI